MIRRVFLMTASFALLAGCRADEGPRDTAGLEAIPTRYAEAWSSGDPVAFTAFYAEDGLLRINDGEASVGRDAVTETACGLERWTRTDGDP